MKALFPVDWNPAEHGYVEDQNDTDFYTRTYDASEIAYKLINNNLVLQARVRMVLIFLIFFIKFNHNLISSYFF